jgi:hypothetical protein
MKPLAITLSGVGKGLRGEDGSRDDLANVQCKPIQNCHKESPLYNKYIIRKMKKL